MLNDLLARWLRLGSQRLQFRAAIERRNAARAERAERAEKGGEENKESLAGNEEADYEIEEQRIDFAELDSDSRSC